MPKAKAAPVERRNLSQKVRTLVLTEAGYRCAVPTCRDILALDLHHMSQVSEGGGDDPENLCPSWHAKYHRGYIPADAIYAYKSMLVRLAVRSIWTLSIAFSSSSVVLRTFSLFR